MSIRNKPNYGIYPINLTTAGTQDLPIIGTRVVLVTALLNAGFINVAGVNVIAGGTIAPSTILNVQIGKALGDPVPLSINTKINVKAAFEFVRLSWAAQPNITAFVLVDDDRAGEGVEADAPAAVLGGSVTISSLVSPTGIASAPDVSCAAGAQTPLVASNASTRAVLIKNLADNPREIRVGDAGAAAAEGVALYPGETLRVQTSAALFAWNPHTGAMPVSITEETN
jgi:hypothetical protein